MKGKFTETDFKYFFVFFLTFIFSSVIISLVTNEYTLIKSGGGTGPVMPGNLINLSQGANS